MITIAVASILLLQAPRIPHEFVFRAAQDHTSVTVAGTFNNWNARQAPMAVDPDRRTWRKTIYLEPGRHAYKFVLDDRVWVVDPANPVSEDDGAGNINSILLVLPHGYDQPARIGDGRITPGGVRHEQRVPKLNYDRGRYEFRITARPGDLERVELLTGAKRLPLARRRGDNVFDFWYGALEWDRSKPLSYAFLLSDGPATMQFGPGGLAPPSEGNRFVASPATFQPPIVPSWVERSVIYQIFPDRFANGDPANDPAVLTPWGDAPTYWNRFGGDVAGVRKRKGHLKDLGVTAIYFNPVMKAPSNHRYDPVDFYRVDPEFGTNLEFANLTRDLYAAGIRVVLDQVFDHVGVTFAPFADVLRWQERSRFVDWFFIHEFPVEVRQNPPYLAWHGFESMPKINVLHPEANTYLLESVDFWMDKAKLSGWRLDVANEVPSQFWRQFRKRVKGIEPETWILGEVWTDARYWLEGDQWDASMNYPFRDAVVRFVALGNLDATGFLNQLMQVYGLYAPQVSRNQMNLISSHDTPRFITLAGGDRALAKLGAIVQFTFAGVPSVYYGEELGMLGGPDPANRRAMEWDRATPDNEILRLYRRLTRLRLGSEALMVGDPVALGAFDDQHVAAFGRRIGGSRAVIAINRSERPQRIALSLAPALGDAASLSEEGFVCGLGGQRLRPDARGVLRLEVPAKGAVLGLSDDSAHRALLRSLDRAAPVPSRS
jgi:glycosidase